jgi:hypothetical protein
VGDHYSGKTETGSSRMTKRFLIVLMASGIPIPPLVLFTIRQQGIPVTRVHVAAVIIAYLLSCSMLVVFNNLHKRDIEKATKGQAGEEQRKEGADLEL